MDLLEKFIEEHQDLFVELTPENRAVFLEIAETVKHLRAAKAKRFFIKVIEGIRKLDESFSRIEPLEAVLRLSKSNWAMVLSFFDTIFKIPHDPDFLRSWTETALSLADKDVDSALSYMTCTPEALKRFGTAGVINWGKQGIDALKAAVDNRCMWGVVETYLKESVSTECGLSLERWRFFLEKSVRIAEHSPAAAEAFVKVGNRACLLLNEEETRQWIDEGFKDYKSEDELIKYFSGTSLKALERRDQIVTGVTLKDCINRLSLICEAFLGEPVRIRSGSVLMGTTGFSGGAATDGKTIFLPDVAPSFGLMKLTALHQTVLMSMLSSESGKRLMDNNSMMLHMQADREMLDRLPGLRTEISKIVKEPPSDSHYNGTGPDFPMPWWGDILPELVKETESTINRLKERAGQEFEEVPPEVIEKMMAMLIAEGNRDRDELWRMFSNILDSMQFDSPGAEELEEHFKTFFYKEWDQTLSDYKLNWCLIRQRRPSEEPNDFVSDMRESLQGMIRLIRRQFMRLKPERFRKFRAQPVGDALDIDALVDAIVDMRSGAGLSENVYIWRDKRIRDVAVLFLMDLSGSTEEKIDGKRVVDIQKEALVMMAEALDAVADPFAIYGFSSEGRFRVDMFSIKEFTEPYDEKVHYRLGNLEPMGLTRMGAVIRHAAYKLEKISALVRLLVILTDGRPYDLEYGNLDYAIADTKKAVLEARRKNIHPFIITSDTKGTEYIRQISSRTQSIVVPKVELLPILLPALYKRLTV